MWKYFTRNNTQKYVNILPNLVNSYNNSNRRSIKTKPALVIHMNQQDIWQQQYAKKVEKLQRNIKFSIGDTVRISRAKTMFAKSYLHNWSEELFVISNIMNTNATVYKLIDFNSEPIEGTFYEQELQKVIKRNNIYQIEKLLKRKRICKRESILVKWLGYSSKFNTWIDKNDFAEYKN